MARSTTGEFNAKEAIHGDDWTGTDRRYVVPIGSFRVKHILRRASRNGRTYRESKDDAPFMQKVVKTTDECGHIEGLEQYEKSDRWERPFGPGQLENLEIRNARGGGTQVKGTTPEYPGHGGRINVEVNFTVGATPTEVKEDPTLLEPKLTFERDQAVSEHLAERHEQREESEV